MNFSNMKRPVLAILGATLWSSAAMAASPVTVGFKVAYKDRPPTFTLQSNRVALKENGAITPVQLAPGQRYVGTFTRGNQTVCRFTFGLSPAPAEISAQGCTVRYLMNIAMKGPVISIEMK